MLIVNADDWGGWPTATNAAFVCFQKGRISSVSAMVFMEDSDRAALIALDCGLNVGLHLNLNRRFTAKVPSTTLSQKHRRVARFLETSKYAQLFYNPVLTNDFRDVFHAQLNEFIRLYGKAPTHFDGHQHMHLCTNMRIDGTIPAGQKMRRNFTFLPGQKSFLNRFYRALVDRGLLRRYRMTDYFFSLAQCLRHNQLSRVADLAKHESVELMTHPEVPDELSFLMSSRFPEVFDGISINGYPQL